MAQWIGHARTNYFGVKDEAAFRAAFVTVEVEIVEIRGMDGMRFALLGNDEYGGFPSMRYVDDEDELVDIDVTGMLIEHLADGEVAVLQEVGAEKLRYLTGAAWAVNNKGERVDVSIDDIYELAKGLGTSITTATY